MGRACFHAMGLGNHEFDDGDQNLAYFIANLTETSKNCPGGSTKVVAANVVPGGTSPLKPILVNSTQFTLGGKKVACPAMLQFLAVLHRCKTMMAVRFPPTCMPLPAPKSVRFPCPVLI